MIQGLLNSFLGGSDEEQMSNEDTSELEAQLSELRLDEQAVATGEYQDESLRESDLAEIRSKISEIESKLSGYKSSKNQNPSRSDAGGSAGDSSSGGKGGGMKMSFGGSSSSGGVSIPQGQSINPGSFDSSAMLQGAQMSSLKGVLSSPVSAQRNLLKQQNSMNTGGFSI